MNFFHKHKISKILIGVPVSIVLLLILIFSVLTIIPLFEGIDRSPVPGTDSWMKDPIMTEDAFERLLDIIEFNGELKARPEMKELVDNSFAEKALKEIGG